MKTNKNQSVAIYENNCFKDSKNRSSLEVIDKNGISYYWKYEYDKVLDEINAVLVCKTCNEISTFCGFKNEAFTANSVAESIAIMKEFGIKVVKNY